MTPGATLVPRAGATWMSSPIGFGYYQVNQRGGRRWSAYDAYLKPGCGNVPT